MLRLGVRGALPSSRHPAAMLGRVRREVKTTLSQAWLHPLAAMWKGMAQAAGEAAVATLACVGCPCSAIVSEHVPMARALGARWHRPSSSWLLP